MCAAAPLGNVPGGAVLQEAVSCALCGAASQLLVSGQSGAFPVSQLSGQALPRCPHVGVLLTRSPSPQGCEQGH